MLVGLENVQSNHLFTADDVDFVSVRVVTVLVPMSVALRFPLARVRLDCDFRRNVHAAVVVIIAIAITDYVRVGLP